MKKFKTLNNWVARAFVAEYCNDNLKACVHLYENCYTLMEDSCWKRLLSVFFSDIVAVERLKKRLFKEHEHVLLSVYQCMYRDFFWVYEF